MASSAWKTPMLSLIHYSDQSLIATCLHNDSTYVPVLLFSCAEISAFRHFDTRSRYVSERDC